MKAKRGIQKCINLLTLIYAIETWTWNAVQQSRICAVKMGYERGACEVSR